MPGTAAAALLRGGMGALLGAVAVALPLPLTLVVADRFFIPATWRGEDLFGLGVLLIGASAVVGTPTGMFVGVVRATRSLGLEASRTAGRVALLLCYPIALALFALYRLDEEALLPFRLWSSGAQAMGWLVVLWPLLTGALAVRRGVPPAVAG